jgi:hypothetical protein
MTRIYLHYFSLTVILYWMNNLIFLLQHFKMLHQLSQPCSVYHRPALQHCERIELGGEGSDECQHRQTYIFFYQDIYISIYMPVINYSVLRYLSLLVHLMFVCAGNTFGFFFALPRRGAGVPGQGPLAAGGRQERGLLRAHSEYVLLAVLHVMSLPLCMLACLPACLLACMSAHGVCLVAWCLL